MGGVFTCLYDFLRMPLGTTPWRLYHALLAVWIAGAAGQLFRFCWECVRFARKAKMYEETDDPSIHAAAQKAADELHMPKPKIVRTGRADTPQIAGVLRPVMLLPAYSYTEEEYYYVFFHELAHWKHHDLWAMACAEVFRAVFWWNPLAYLLKHSLSDILELKCDKAVLQGRDKEEVEAYKNVLLKTFICSEQQKGHLPSTVSMELASRERKAILQRFSLILEPRWNPRTEKIALAISAVFMALLLLFSYSFVLQPYHAPPQDEIEEVIDGVQAVEITPENTYFIEHKDGTYTMVYNDGEIVDDNVSEESMEIYKLSGFEIRKEDGG